MFQTGVLGFVLFFCLVTPRICSADDIYPGKWWRMPELSTELGLTDAQKRHLDELFMSNRGRLVERKTALERERVELSAVLDREPMDEAGIMAQLKRLESARTELSAERLRFGLEVRRILGYERFLKLKAYFKERERRPLPSTKRSGQERGE